MVRYVVKRRGKYYPSRAMKKIAVVSDESVYQKAAENPVKFWEKLALEGISWDKKFTKTYEEKIPYFRWFYDGKLNFCYNALDRHIKEGKGDKIALIWVPEPESEQTIKLTYNQLYEKVNRFANVLKKNGIKRKDVVSIYLPLIPEALVAMLACTRLGAIHSVVFSAFSPDALKSRIDDSKAKILVTADGYYRRGKEIRLLENAIEAAKKTTVKKIIVVNRLPKKVEIKGNLLDFHKEIEKAGKECKPVSVNSEDIMFILYTSGTTGKPKGIIHDTGGYAVQSYWTTKYTFNIMEQDVMWCTADIGWITGHTYAFYGPLLNGATTLIYEGSPDFPDPSRWWKIADENKVTIFYTAPTAIRMFIKFGEKWIKKYKMKPLRLLATVGEPIDEYSWKWYFKYIGKKRCPIIDTWWQTETGGTLINTLPGIGPFIPTFAGRSFPGTRHEILDDEGKNPPPNQTGFLAQLSPFAPGMLRGVYKNPKKYSETYWDKFKTKYDTSDGAYLSKEGFIRITGRTDDVMKVAGHRMSTAELENAINTHPNVVECGVVPIADSLKGQVPVAFAVLKNVADVEKEKETLEKGIIKQVDKKIGPTARPSKVYFVNDLPKTRSGKIMRRILKNILNNEEPEGLMTLFNPESVEEIKTVVRNNPIIKKE
jgi:acetyl-CoA synthetase